MNFERDGGTGAQVTGAVRRSGRRASRQWLHEPSHLLNEVQGSTPGQLGSRQPCEADKQRGATLDELGWRSSAAGGLWLLSRRGCPMPAACQPARHKVADQCPVCSGKAQTAVSTEADSWSLGRHRPPCPIRQRVGVRSSPGRWSGSERVLHVRMRCMMAVTRLHRSNAESAEIYWKGRLFPCLRTDGNLGNCFEGGENRHVDGFENLMCFERRRGSQQVRQVWS